MVDLLYQSLLVNSPSSQVTLQISALLLLNTIIRNCVADDPVVLKEIKIVKKLKWEKVFFHCKKSWPWILPGN